MQYMWQTVCEYGFCIISVYTLLLAWHVYSFNSARPMFRWTYALQYGPVVCGLQRDLDRVNIEMPHHDIHMLAAGTHARTRYVKTG